MNLNLNPNLNPKLLIALELTNTQLTNTKKYKIRRSRYIQVPVSVTYVHLSVSCMPITHHVCYSNRVYILHIALELGLNIESVPSIYDDGITVLEHAVSHDNIIMVALCISYGGDVNGYRGYPLWRATVLHGEILDILIAAGANVRYPSPFCAMERAIREGEIGTVLKLLTAGAVIPQNAVQLVEYSLVDRDLKLELIHSRLNK